MYKVFLSVLCLSSLLIFPAVSATKVAETPTSEQAKQSQAKSELIKINSATVAQLSALSGIGEAKAAAIVEYRQVHGKFDSVDQLTEVKGIGEKLIEKNRSQLSL
ncbi:competence protein ComEA helix-hairpin-helix repeat protein [Shewanella halifaxensis HAW-EB4]|uniref:Competence protein ComEA helix-hairpin-helix repeat protein n=1 Tax=Shewanella halifaxensis (strain HAW-EB4) TaxID=458817 RepID=B0TLT0_SHEHH|nr:helix-hairpin-helix domain-containing protein [Shewanella halifaxensis]ABZ77302.1 competence protein ComEA helix-hairpin-helix repeat protein [Shewanella halifaxensis HAW-EB4]